MSTSRRTRTWSRARGRVAVLAAAGVALAACGGGGDSDTASPEPAAEAISQEEIDAAMQEPTTLTFWTWVPDIQDEVDLFEAKYPAIDVEVVNAGQGTPQYTKLRTALSAGTGAPDAVQIEFQYIPTFTITEDLLDLAPYGAAEFEDQFVEWTWAQVTGEDGQVWAYPQDTGPMGMLYRQDIFDQYGITPPATWDEFAEAARTLNAADPNVFITNLASNQGGAYMGLLWQAGAMPFQTDGGEALTVDLNSEAAQTVASYWGELVEEGVVATDADFNDGWYQALNSGKYATWLTAAWGPVFLQGSAASTSGLWRAAPLPQWEEGEEVSGNWGGSTTAVIQDTENPIAAAELAKFINTDPESTTMLATQQFLFPATNAVLEDPAFTGQTPEFYGGQKVNEIFAGISDTVPTDFTWAPFMDQVYTDWNETVGKSLADRQDTVSATDAWQDRTVQYAEGQGFTIEEP